MRGLILALVFSLFGSAALAGDVDSAIGNETPNAEQSRDKVKSETTDGAKEPEPFRVPPGYQAKTRGKKVMYCKKSMESGTRFAQERCFSEEQLRAMEAKREEEHATFDQSRKVCANPENCSGG
jgi:hypothetical protein